MSDQHALASRSRLWSDLQIGRAYHLSGDSLKADNAYKEFFALWKDADPDIPMLKQAKAEYAGLHGIEQ